MSVDLPEKAVVYGVDVSLLKSYTETVELVFRQIADGNQLFVVAINPEKIHACQKDPELLTMINSADLNICDGIGAAFAVRVLERKSVARITGVQLFEELVEKSSKVAVPIFLLGAKNSVVEKASKNLKQQFPNLKIAGYQDGYFDDDKSVIEQINNSGAELLFVALGSPRQEQWICDNRHELDVSLLMGVGGTFDVFAGEVKRAPGIFRKTGTEFLYRLITQPSRIKRQMKLPFFAIRCVFDGLLSFVRKRK